MKYSLIFFLILSLSNFGIGQTYLHTDFENGIPSTWSADACWKYGDGESLSSTDFYIPDHTNFVAVNDDKQGQNGISKGDLISAEIDLTSASNVIFSFDYLFNGGDYGNLGQEKLNLYIQKVGYDDWKEIKLPLVGCHCWNNLHINLSEYAGDKIILKFSYSDGDNWNFGAAIDNILIKEAEGVDGFFYTIDPSHKRIANKYEINYKIGFCYLGKEKLVDPTFSFEGGNVQYDDKTTELQFFDSIEIVIPNLNIDTYSLSSAVLSNNQTVFEGNQIDFQLFPSIYPFVHEDLDNNEFDIYNTLQSGKSVLLNYTTSWCDFCKDAVPDLNKITEENPNLEIHSIFLDENANEQTITDLNWGESFPLHAFSIQGLNSYSILNQLHGNNVPFLVLICPNKSEPEWSEITWSSAGWDAGTAAAIKYNANFCGVSTANEEISELQNGLVISPNPTDGILNIESIKNTPIESIEVFNLLGQKIISHPTFDNEKATLDLSPYKGTFIIKTKSADIFTSKKIEFF